MTVGRSCKMPFTFLQEPHDFKIPVNDNILISRKARYASSISCALDDVENAQHLGKLNE
jgi:hypothetical protein